MTRPGTRCADRGARKGPVLFRFLHSARLTGNLLTLGQIRHPTIKTNDYYPLIARAVERLDRSTGEARRAVYERARKAVAELRSNQPALLDAEITEERLALEEAIRMVEAEAARKSPTETRTEPRPAPSEGMPDDNNTQSRDHGQPASPDRDDRPPALPSRQAPIFLLTASDDRHNTDIQAVAIGRAYGADHYHDDIPGSRWRGRLLVVMAVLALAVLAGTVAYRAMFGGSVFPALPPIIKAGTGPNNIVRNNSDILAEQFEPNVHNERRLERKTAADGHSGGAESGAARHFNDPDFFQTEPCGSSPACACAGCYCARY